MVSQQAYFVFQPQAFITNNHRSCGSDFPISNLIRTTFTNLQKVVPVSRIMGFIQIRESKTREQA